MKLHCEAGNRRKRTIRIGGGTKGYHVVIYFGCRIQKLNTLFLNCTVGKDRLMYTGNLNIKVMKEEVQDTHIQDTCLYTFPIK